MNIKATDIVARLRAASEHDEGIDPAETQALFIEAADAIEMLRELLEDPEQNDLAYIKPLGSS